MNFERVILLLIYDLQSYDIYKYIYCMNPEISPWMLIADKQRYNDLKREHE